MMAPLVVQAIDPSGLIVIPGLIAWRWYKNRKAKKLRKRIVENSASYEVDRTFVSSEFAKEDDYDKAGCLKGKGLIAALSPESGRPLFAPCLTKPHAALIGSTGSGKSSALLNMLCRVNTGVFCLDSGELAAVSWKALQANRPTVRLSPYPMFEAELANIPRVGFNALGRWLQRENLITLAVRCGIIASAIVLRDENAREQYWANTARQLIKVVCMGVALYMPAERRNLAEVARIITTEGEVQAFAKWVLSFSNDPYICMKLSRYANPTPNPETEPGKSAVPPKSLQDVVQTAMTEMEFLTEQAVAEFVSRDDLDLSDVMFGNLSVLMTSAQEFVGELTRLRRLLLACFLNRFTREDAAYAEPTTLVIDELYTLKYVEQLDEYFTLMRKMSLGIVISIPSTGLLAQMYPNSFKGILDSCGLKIWFDANLDDAELVSKMCGQRQVARCSKSLNWSPGHDWAKPTDRDIASLHVTDNNTTETVPLIMPHELANGGLKRDEVICFIGECPKPIKAKKLTHLSLPKIAQPNPFYTRKGRPAQPRKDWKALLTE